ncbi:MAG: D-alanyl-D-alanine carboxypeptidase family protein [Eubacteriales bacterium]|nr:D-alanyl-D-alanine carboxypeptidase family protein [Eubacteriales bacterium]
MKSMKNMIIKLASLVLALTLIVPSFAGTVFAVEWPDECYVASEGACVMDANSGVVLYGKQENESFYPASITKVMTALITLENCKDLNEMVTFSQSAVSFEEENSTIIGASEGDRLSVKDCLYSLLFQSANEVANALSEHVGAKHPELKSGNETDREVFVKMMNMKAEELGCKGTHFNNPSGLTDSNHYTTPYDMCLILAEAIKNEAFIDIEAHTYWTHAPIKRYPDPEDPWNTVYPKHMMLKRNSHQYYKGAFAGKTGYTMNAGNTLVTAAERDGMVLVATVMNAHNNHYNDTRRLFDFGFDNFKSIPVNDFDNMHVMLEKDMSIAGIPLIDTKTMSIDNSYITLPEEADVSDVSKKLELPENGTGKELGRVVYSYNDRVVGNADIKIKELGDISDMDKAEEDPLLYNYIGKDEMESNAIEENAPVENPSSQQETLENQAQGESEVKNDTVTNESEVAEKKDEKENIFGIPKFAMTILKVFVVLIVIAAILLLFMLHQEKKEAIARARRRQQRLKHTKDLTGQQNIKMDLMVQQRLRKRKK